MGRPRKPLTLAALGIAVCFGLGFMLLGSLAGRSAQALPPGAITGARVLAPDHVRLTVESPIADLTPGNFRVTDERAPDVPMEIKAVERTDARHLLLTVGERLDPASAYRISVRSPAGEREAKPGPWMLLFTVVISSALINNFVFTRYLGLCIFFGVSKKRDTSVGMGFTFLIVMFLSAAISWALYNFVMRPLELRFLQIIIFIGVVAFLVQALDTILRKTHASLHQRFGVYLVLITTNCIILAVPLLNAQADTGAGESLALAFGSGAGFALALFLMSCAREKLELARVPAAFQGLPIAFALAGLFALAFMGFSGLTFLR
jgi:H+/Na+-translocating ferredoxin:NAD+ oxidoreductase subunit A